MVTGIAAIFVVVAIVFMSMVAYAEGHNVWWLPRWMRGDRAILICFFSLCAAFLALGIIIGINAHVSR